MIQILPSVNCHYKDTEAVVARIGLIAQIFDLAGANGPIAHFDVADGIFTFNKSWDEPERLRKLAPSLAFEVHLMTENPRLAAERWIAAGARRVIVHMEAAPPRLFAEISVAAREAGAEAVLAMNPETPAENAAAYFHATASFLVLGVNPGFSGQKFLPRALQTVAFLRRVVPNAQIEVDGGINPETARAAIVAGADALVSDSFIFRNANPKAALAELEAIANN